MVKVRGGLRVLSVYIWHSEGWTQRNEALREAVVKQAKATRHPWLIACDAHLCHEDFDKSLWFLWASKVKRLKRTYDYVITCHSLKEKSRR